MAEPDPLPAPGSPQPRPSGPRQSGPRQSGPRQSGPRPSDDAFRAALGRFATGVSVMTTVSDGVPHGMTANAVSSVSLDPQLVLVCVDRGTTMAQRVRESGVFGLSFLAADQAALSAWFADPSRPDASQFGDVAFRTEASGAPILDDTLGWLDCRVVAIHVAGDHDIVVGEVLALGAGPAGEPLVYFASDYHRLQDSRDARP